MEHNSAQLDHFRFLILVGAGFVIEVSEMSLLWDSGLRKKRREGREGKREERLGEKGKVEGSRKGMRRRKRERCVCLEKKALLLEE